MARLTWTVVFQRSGMISLLSLDIIWCCQQGSNSIYCFEGYLPLAAYFYTLARARNRFSSCPTRGLQGQSMIL